MQEYAINMMSKRKVDKFINLSFPHGLSEAASISSNSSSQTHIGLADKLQCTGDILILKYLPRCLSEIQSELGALHFYWPITDPHPHETQLSCVLLTQDDRRWKVLVTREDANTMGCPCLCRGLGP